MTLYQPLPSLRCQAHWQNAQSQRYNQILPKSLPARPTPTHGGQDSAAKINDKLTGKINNETPTKCKCHKGFRGMRRSEVRFNLSCILIGNHPQSLTALTLDRWRSL
jgi:hypothetical protein